MTQLVQMTVGDACQALEAYVTKQLESALTELVGGSDRCRAKCIDLGK